MLNNIFKLRTLFIGLFLAMLFGSCKKSFIDGQRPTDSGSADQVFASPASVRSYFTGIYRSLRRQWTSTDGSAGGSDDAYSYNSIFLARVVKGKDITMPKNNWYYFDYQNDNREPTYRRVRFTWYFLYELANQVNVLIDGTQKSTTLSAGDKVQLVGEARALRAFCYFELAREFQLAYSKNPSAPGVPVYTTPATDTTVGHPRGTMQQTFAQINSDIEYAIKNLQPTSRSQKDQIDVSVAWGLAARIYLEQGRWEDAANAADSALTGGGYDLDNAGYHNNYNGLTSNEVLWGLPQTTSNGGQSLYYGTPSSFFDRTGAGYDAFCMSAELVDQFSTTDIRNTFFINLSSDGPSSPDYYCTNKFGKGSGYGVELLTGAVVEQTTIDFNESMNLMRAAELYLIEAEGLARQNNDVDAHDILFYVQSTRDPDAVKSANTGQALIDEILLERRKELYGEMGVDWLDAKRLQLPLDRSGSNHTSALAYTIPANDPRFMLKIPQQEIQANKNMSPADQNP